MYRLNNERNSVKILFKQQIKEWENDDRNTISQIMQASLFHFRVPTWNSNESENNLPIGLAYRLAEDPHYYGPESPLLLSILEQGKVVGVAVRTPPHRIILSRIDANIQVAIVHLIRYLRGINTRIPGVVGPAAEAQVFSDCWIEDQHSVSSKIVMRLRVFEARQVADLPLSQGKLRLARMDDHLLMAQWFVAFSEEIGEPADLESAKKTRRTAHQGSTIIHLGSRCAGFYRRRDASDEKWHNNQLGVHTTGASQ